MSNKLVKSKPYKYQDTPLISNWAELAKCESETHYLVIGEYNGFIYKKGIPKDDQCPIYLSTHTFYGSNYEDSTNILQECGFKIHLKNWDE